MAIFSVRDSTGNPDGNI